MYEAFFGFNSKPFQLNPDPSFYYSSKPHQRARAYLEYGVVRGEGFIVVTGEVGAGKTTIVRGLLDSLDAKSLVAAHLVSTQLGAEDTLRLVAAAFGVKARDVSKAELILALEAFFTTQVTKGRRCLLVVDEAQNLQPQAVEELRMLSNFQYGQTALLQTFLIGQPEFRDILQSPGMLQLRQRITASCHLGPLDRQEAQGYIEHRLACVGAQGRPTWDAEAFDRIFDHTQGIPRRINTLCDRLLLHAFLAESTHITAALVAEVLAEFQEEWACTGVPSGAAASVGGVATPPASSGPDTGPDSVLPDDAGELDFELPEGVAQSLDVQVTRVALRQLYDQMRRIERSVLRQERTHLELLGMLKTLVAGSRRPRSDDPPS